MPFLTMGWTGIVLAGLSAASDTYWYTSEHNIRNISNFKFNKRITYGDKLTKNIEHDFASDICLVYNLRTKAYVRCTEEEIKEAKLDRPRAHSGAINQTIYHQQPFYPAPFAPHIFQD